MTDADLAERLRILAGHYKRGTLGAITCHAAASRIETLASASVDTLPKGQDAKQGLAGTEGSAVPKADAQNPSKAAP